MATDITELNKDTKVKYIDNNMLGSPTLGLTRGDLVRLLKTVLVDGFNSKIASTVTPEILGNIVTITFPAGHGFVFNQVIKISGANEINFNGQYRILQSDAISIKIITKTSFSSITGTVTVSIAPLGFSLAYDDITNTGTACFKNTSTKTPGVLKIIDALPPNGYDTNWSRFARVVAGQQTDSYGEFINNEKFPYHSSYPFSEKTGNGVSGATGIHSLCRWDYGLRPYNGNSYWADSLAVSSYGYGTFPTNWRIIGDSNTFYLFIQSMGRDYSGYNICSFGIYIPTNPSASDNLYLIGGDGWVSSDNQYPYVTQTARRNSFTYFGGDSDSFGLFLFKNVDQNIQHYLEFMPVALYFSDSNRQWPYKSLIKGLDPTTGNLLTSPVYLKDTNQDFRGQLRGLQQFYGSGQLSNNLLLDNNNSIVLSTKLFEWTTSSTNSEQVPYLFSLKDWEEI